MEWALLIVLVPAVVIPVVLLLGYTGCGPDFGTALSPPTGLAATATGPQSIVLTWQFVGGSGYTFLVERATLTGPFVQVAAVPTSLEHTDTKDLVPEAAFRYRVRTTSSTSGNMSVYSNIATATTLPLPWKPVAAPVLTDNDGERKGDCIVQRIPSAMLTNTGTKVKLTVGRSTAEPLVIDRIYISRARPGAGTPGSTDQLWDPAGDRKKVGPDNFVVDTPEKELPPVDYALDPTQDLLIAFDISANLAGCRRGTVPGATAFINPDTHEAGLVDRSATGYQTRANTVYLIRKIEVQ